jgi:hypothetical protein
MKGAYMNPRTAAFAACIATSLAFLGFRAGAQESDALVRSYQRNFVRSSLSIKIDVLREAANYANADMGPLYRMGVRFALDNAQYLQSDVQLRDVAAISVAGLHRSRSTDAVSDLWSLFQIFTEPYVRVPVLEALGDLAAGNSQAILNINTFLYNQNAMRQAGSTPDYQVLEACVLALGKLGSATSYSVIFGTFAAGYSDAISRKSLEAMASIQGDYKGYLIEVIREESSIKRSAALKAAIENLKFSDADKAEVAESALDMTLTYASANSTDVQIVREIRSRASRELAARGWTRASGLAVKAFNLANAEYARGTGTKAAILESIALLGAMRTTEAAQALTLQLQLLNATADSGAAVDEQIAMAVISNLGSLGDKVAFEHLLFVGYLGYPENIKGAAREALKMLKL